MKFQAVSFTIDGIKKLIEEYQSNYVELDIDENLAKDFLEKEITYEQFKHLASSELDIYIKNKIKTIDNLKFMKIINLNYKIFTLDGDLNKNIDFLKITLTEEIDKHKKILSKEDFSLVYNGLEKELKNLYNEAEKIERIKQIKKDIDSGNIKKLEAVEKVNKINKIKDQYIYDINKEKIFSKVFFKENSLLLSSFFLTFAVSVGFIYNYVLFIEMLKFDIFNFLSFEDLIFSWLGNGDILLILVTILFVTLIIYFIYEVDIYKKVSENHNTKLSILFLFLTVIFSFLAYENFSDTYIYFIYILMLYFSFTSLLYFAFYRTKKFNIPSITNLIMIYVPLVYVITIFTSLKYAENLYTNSNFNKCTVKLVRNLEPLNSKNNFQFVSKTSSFTVFLVQDIYVKNFKRIQVISNNDISTIYFNDIIDTNPNKIEVNSKENQSSNSNQNVKKLEEKLKIYESGCEQVLQECKKTDCNKNDIINNYYSFGISPKIDKLFLTKLNSLINNDFNGELNIEYNSFFNNTKYKLKKIHENKKIYFDQASLLVDENEFNKAFNNLSLKEIFKKDKKFIINLIGSSSLEKLTISKNKIKDNYSLSLARANNTKFFIMKNLLDKKIDIQNIKFNTFGISNEKSVNKHSSYRYVNVEILEYVPVNQGKV